MASKRRKSNELQRTDTLGGWTDGTDHLHGRLLKNSTIVMATLNGQSPSYLTIEHWNQAVLDIKKDGWFRSDRNPGDPGT